MKTFLFFSFLMALAFTACNKDDEIANPALKDAERDFLINDESELSTYPGHCKEINTVHELVGKGSWEITDAGTQFVLNAGGKTILGEAEGWSELNLTFDDVTQTFYGEIISRYQAASMKHSFYGRIELDFADQPDEKDALAVEGSAEIVRGLLSTERGNFNLSDGAALKVSVNRSPEGEVSAIVSIDGLYCKKANLFTGRK